MTSLRSELRLQVRLAAPVALTQLTMMAMPLVDLLMVGKVDKVAMGAVSLGNVWRMASLIVAQGIVFGIDPFVSQACGARDARGMGLALQRGLVLAVYLTVPVGALWLFTEPGLRALGQDPELTPLAAEYVLVQAPSILPFLAYAALRQYLTGRRILWPALWVTIGANVVNVFLNWVLIFGHLGLPALGSTGSGIATGSVQAAMFVALVVLVRVKRLHVGAWVGWERSVWRPGALAPVLRKGLPVGVTIALEMWAFSLATLLAGDLGADSLARQVDLAAHTVVLNMASISFMVPLGVSIAASARVGNLLGERRPEAAQRAAWVALALGAGAMSIAAAVFVLGGAELARLYRDEAVVVAACASILPIAATFQVFDGIQVVGSGILRGMGRTLPAAAFNLLAYYGLALPFALWFTHGLGLGLPGLWWALALGIAIVALSLVGWIGRRGPGHDPEAMMAVAEDAESVTP